MRSEVQHGWTPATHERSDRSVDHAVHFYGVDEELVRRAAAFLANGLDEGEAALVIATGAHLVEVERGLALRGHDPAGARRAGRLVTVRAEEALAELLVQGTPDRARFRRLLEPLVERALLASTCRRARVYGELDLLWRRGHARETLRLEHLWDDLVRAHPVSLLCAYRLDDLPRGAPRDERGRGGQAPRAAGGPGAGREGSDRQERAAARIDALERRARALELELARRTRAEDDAARELAAERAARDRLLGMVGHDLRNPLNAITMSAGALLRAGADEKVARAARRIVGSAGRMERLIAQLLEFAQARQGAGIPVRRRTADLAEVARHVVDELEAARPGRRLALETDGDLAGTWDADRIAEVLSNLVGNALEHGSDPISLRLRADGEEVVAEVHNAGEPIPPELLPHLFDPFRRGAGAAPSRGVGLGLFISREIVRAHGGSIAVSSTAAAGTTFAVRLPREPGGERAAAGSPVVRQPGLDAG